MKDFIADEKDLLWQVNQFIHDNPEIGFEEHQASDKMVQALRGAGFHVTYPTGGMPTAFQATLTNGSDRPHVAILAEYDALPGIGHGCGHNLIATSALATGLALAGIMPFISGRVSVIGTPAEEFLVGGGKVCLIEHGIFDDIDVAMMAHPFNWNLLGLRFLAVNEISVRFDGKSSHAAADPYLGVNAFDAVQLTFTAISFLRQQLRPDTRVHWGELEVSGAKNVIPDSSSTVIDVRAGDNHYVEEVTAKVLNCIKGAALMTGCKADYKVSKGYQAPRLNLPLEELYRRNLKLLGVELDETPPGTGVGSTDMGNVSQIVPAIHPFFKITGGVPVHSPEFCHAASTLEAFEASLKAAEALALTAIDLLKDSTMLQRVKDAFRNGVASGSVYQMV